MRVSATLLVTTKETPAEAEIVSHQLMLRAGLIRQLAAGLYSWLPLGWRVARKVEQIVREEMDRAGALEMIMPAVQPAELWRESGRWDMYGPELLRLHDRHQREFCVGPTHEEVITDIARRDIRSYKQLPINVYQIQTKFRDEVRPRFGVMRSREFVMKDAYSFDLDAQGMQQSYDKMHDAYVRAFRRTGLDFRVVAADSGAIGGNRSQEFHVLAQSGEDAIAFSEDGQFAANVELIACDPPSEPRAEPLQSMSEVATPNVHTMLELAQFLSIDVKRTVKTLLVEGNDDGLVALCVRGDHELNAIKAAELDPVAVPFRFASAERIRSVCGASAGAIGPVGLEIPIIVDASVDVMSDFVCGANRDDYHLTGVNFGRDLAQPQVADIRNAMAGDPAPGGTSRIAIARGIEVGHIFQLGTKYSEAMNAVVLGEDGKARTLQMGCYGIGITRVVAAAIEQNHDDNGIIWPSAIAPYQVMLLPMNMHRSVRLQQAVERLYQALSALGLEVLMDDRAVRPGVMFADADLIGIPHQIVLGDRGLDSGTVEYKRRGTVEREEVAFEHIEQFVCDKIRAELTVD